MQYLLTTEEFHSLVPKEKYKKATVKIEELNEKVLELSNYSCHQGRGFVCDECPIGAFGTNTCSKSFKRYSK